MVVYGTGFVRPPLFFCHARAAEEAGADRFGLGGGVEAGALEELKDALTRITAAADIIRGRAVLVHALNGRARSFWEKYGFERCPVNDLRLMLLGKDLRAALRR